MVRKSTTTQGKPITFNVDEHYCLENDNPEKIYNEVFAAMFPTMPFALGYTKVMHDKGYNGITLERYDNGLVGYQNFCVYANTEEEILDAFNRYSRLSDDAFGGVTFGLYTDVTIFKNPRV